MGVAEGQGRVETAADDAAETYKQDGNLRTDIVEEAQGRGYHTLARERGSGKQSSVGSNTAL